MIIILVGGAISILIPTWSSVRLIGGLNVGYDPKVIGDDYR